MKVTFHKELLILPFLLYVAGKALSQDFSFAEPTLVPDSLLPAAIQPAETAWWATPRRSLLSAWHKQQNATVRDNNRGEVIGVHPTEDKIYLLQQNTRRGKVRVLTARYQQGQWSEPTLLFQYKKGSKQNGAYVSPDEDYIIFPQRSRGGYGQEDLYVVWRKGAGWSDPVNLGPTVNTEGSEIAPFMQGEILFFSAYYSSEQDYDLFQTHRLYQNWKVWEKPTNLVPLNSPAQDAFLTLHPDGQAYFVSKRAGAPRAYRTTTTDTRPRSATSSSKPASDTIFSEEAIKTLLNSEQGLVFFSKNSWLLESQYKELLVFISDQIKNQADIKLQLIGHTDQEGTRAYNKKLSKNRAAAIKEFLVSLGIEDQRLEIVALGEAQPLTEETSEEAQHKNRRVEIVVVKKDS